MPFLHVGLAQPAALADQRRETRGEFFAEEVAHLLAEGLFVGCEAQIHDHVTPDDGVHVPQSITKLKDRYGREDGKYGWVRRRLILTVSRAVTILPRQGEDRGHQKR